MTRAGAWGVRAAATLAALTLAPAALSGCGASPTPLGPAGVDGLTIPTPSPRPADFAGRAENPWFPLRSGTRWVYRQYTPTGSRTVVATVLPGPRDIAGVPTTAVRWQVRTGLHDRTAMVRWYAVDIAGNVWWFGQRVLAHTPRLDRLAPASWLAGRDGARAGLVLTDPPRLGDGYFNALQPGVVERRSTVVSLTATVATTGHTFRHTIATRDLSALHPLHVVQSYYARGLGLVAQQDTVATSSSMSLMRMRRG
ncbi:MAG TPA: hypothetical protein VHR85_05420 [Nocardioides sp.]|jgi:hypothetical protein|nr:hypothetical protein [Nocardioides sp.]